MSQNPALIAAKTNIPEVFVIDSSKQLENADESSCNPDLRLRGHDKEGYGLSWISFQEGYLLSGSSDCKICLWDVSALPQEQALHGNYIYEGHENVVEDVSWHLKDENLFDSVGDDCKFVIWDLLTNKFTTLSCCLFERGVLFIFQSINSWVLATSSSGSTIGLFDMPKLSSPLHAISSHENMYSSCSSSPMEATKLAFPTFHGTRINLGSSRA